MFAEVQPMSLFSSFKSVSYRLWDEQSNKLISFAHLKRLRKQTKKVEDLKTDIGQDESQESDRQTGAH
jgi:hypothetical protein